MDEEYGQLRIKIKVKKDDLAKKGGEIFSQSTDLFSEIETFVHTEAMRRKYPLLKIEVDEPY